MDEVRTVKAIVETVVGTRTRLLTVEYKQWKGLRGKDYLSKQRMKRQVRGGQVIVSEIRETLRLFTRLVTERDMLHEKDYIAKITSGGRMKIVWRSRGSAVGTRLIYIISHQQRFLWKNARY